MEHFTYLSLLSDQPHRRQVIKSCLISLFMLVGLGCESTKIFAEPERPPAPIDEALLSVGVCSVDEDCPQWTCVISTCKEGLCIPERIQSPSLEVNTLLSDEHYISLSLREDQLLAVVGEPDDTQEGAHSLGVGTGLRRWELDEKGQWSEADQWSPELVRITIRPPLVLGDDPEEQREPLTLRGVTLTEGGVWLHAGDQLRDLWFGSWKQSTNQGTYHRLAAPLQSITQDEEEKYVSNFHSLGSN